MSFLLMIPSSSSNEVDEDSGPYAMNFQNNVESTPHILIKPGKSIERIDLSSPYDQAVSLAEGNVLKSDFLIYIIQKFKLRFKLAEFGIVYAHRWSLWRLFSFNLSYS